MKKRTNRIVLTGLALTALAPFARAQSSVTIYGLLDAYVEQRSNMTTSGSRRMVNSGGMNTSRLGFRGTEDLGGGWKAVFQLESEVNLDSGQAAGGGTAFWGRQANVGLDGAFGRVVVGRSYSTTYDLVLPFDPLGYAPNYSWATSAGAAGGGATGGARKDGMVTGVSNMIKYRGTFGPVTLGATVGAPEGTTVKVYAVGGGATFGPVALVATWDQVQALPVAGGARDKTRSAHVGATLAVTDAIKLYAVLRDYDKRYAVAGPGGSNDKSRTWWVGASAVVAPPLTLTAAYYKQDIRDGKTLGGIEDPSMIVLRARYALSKRTDLYTVLGYAKADGAPVSLSRDDTAFDTKQTGIAVGMQHRF